MEHFEFLFDTDTALMITFIFGVVIAWLLIAFMNGMDAIFRYVEEYKINKKIKELEKLKEEVKNNENH